MAWLRAFFGPVLGIFGHGNVGGLGEALEWRQDRLRFIPVRNEQAMVHAAAGYAWFKRRLGALAVTSSVGPRGDQHGYWRRRRDDQPVAASCCYRVTCSRGAMRGRSSSSSRLLAARQFP